MNDRHPHDEQRRIGQGMIAAGFIVGLVLLTLFFGDLERDAANPNANAAFTRGEAGVIEVVLELNRGDQYVMSGTINGADATFILDTGATDVVIPEDIAEAAGLRYGRESRAMTANGMVTVYDTTIDTLDLGAIRLRDVGASINPAMSGAVLLGMSALHQIEFHQRNGELTLRYYPQDL